MKHLVAPSILAANFNNLDKEVKLVNNSQADWFHLDVMDGLFVPNISFGIPIVKHINKIAKKPLDVHLMIENPSNYIEKFKNCGADILTVHYEACKHLHRVIENIKKKNMKAGVAINPHTPVNLLKDILKDIDLVCIMSVNPGFGGQSFILQTHEKIKKLAKLKIENNFLIEVDGGVNIDNAKEIIKSGADVLVAGSSVFKSENPESAIDKIKNLS
tara:strand:- start:632 stop:1279 length:648 start_codon:yes stop_codon:yes gene_type:complete